MSLIYKSKLFNVVISEHKNISQKVTDPILNIFKLPCKTKK